MIKTDKNGGVFVFSRFRSQATEMESAWQSEVGGICLSDQMTVFVDASLQEPYSDQDPPMRKDVRRLMEKFQ